MAWIIGGFAVLLFMYATLRAFANATPGQAKQALVVGSAVVGGLLVLLLLLSGRGNMAFTGALLFGPALWRAYKGWQAKQVFSRGAAEGETAVDTATLEMRLDLSSGEMRGSVKRGPFTGQSLAAMAPPRLLELLADCRAEDPESVPLLEAWLDRVAPDWRVPEAEPLLDRAAALAVLGLREDATGAEIRGAHRRAMRHAHPDAGGDAALAARLNAARDFLLGD